MQRLGFYLFLVFMGSGPASAALLPHRAVPPALTAEQAANLARINQAWEVENEARDKRFGDPRPLPAERPWYRSVELKPEGSGTFVPITNAERCPTKVFKEKLGPVRNQAGLGVCFAAVAADLLSLAVGRRISHFDLSLRYFHSAPASKRRNAKGEPVGENPSVMDLYAGFVSEALAAGMSGGLCTDDEVRTQDFLVANYDKVLPKVGKGDETGLLAASIMLIDNMVGRDISELLEMPNSTCNAIASAQLLFPKLTSWQVISAFTSARSKEEAFHWMLNQACERNVKPVRAGWMYAEASKPAAAAAGPAFLAVVDEAIDHEAPVVVEMNAKRYHAVAAKDRKVTDAPHAAILVGREFRDGVCKYLVRDSAGPTCAGFAPPYNSEANCERGHYWISEKDFNETVRRIGVAR